VGAVLIRTLIALARRYFPRNILGAIDMRGLIFLIVVACGAVWAFDAYEYDGRYTDAAWQKAHAEGQYFSHEVQRRIDSILSGN